jgi:Protein of unknown function (DUF2490)
MDLAVWEALFVQVAPSETSGLRIWMDAQARRDEDQIQGIVRPGIGWALSPQVALWAGYAWIPSAAPGDPLSSEHRAWQQVTWTEAIGPVVVGVRPRLEQRFAPNAGPGVRGRLFARAQLDIVRPLGLVVWDEPFLSMIDSDFGPAGFDQNRLFVGPCLRYEEVRVEVGYMDQRTLVDGEWTPRGVISTSVFTVF